MNPLGRLMKGLFPRWWLARQSRGQAIPSWRLSATMTGAFVEDERHLVHRVLLREYPAQAPFPKLVMVEFPPRELPEQGKLRKYVREQWVAVNPDGNGYNGTGILRWWPDPMNYRPSPGFVLFMEGVLKGVKP